jgi:hypothetical protein
MGQAYIFFWSLREFEGKVIHTILGGQVFPLLLHLKLPCQTGELSQIYPVLPYWCTVNLDIGVDQAIVLSCMKTEYKYS